MTNPFIYGLDIPLNDLRLHLIVIFKFPLCTALPFGLLIC